MSKVVKFPTKDDPALLAVNRLSRLLSLVEQAPKRKEVSTRRKATSGTVHEMADLGVDFLCGRRAPEPFAWTEDPVTCKRCLAAINLAARAPSPEHETTAAILSDHLDTRTGG